MCLVLTVHSGTSWRINPFFTKFLQTNIVVRATKGTLHDKVNHDNPDNAINRFELTEVRVRDGTYAESRLFEVKIYFFLWKHVCHVCTYVLKTEQALVRIAAAAFPTVGCVEDVTSPDNQGTPVIPIADAFAAVIDRYQIIVCVRLYWGIWLTDSDTRSSMTLCCCRCWQTLASGKRIGPDGVVTNVTFRADVLYTEEMDCVLKVSPPIPVHSAQCGSCSCDIADSRLVSSSCWTDCGAASPKNVLHCVLFSQGQQIWYVC